MKSFYDFNRNSPEERQEQYKLYPEMALFHVALREELSDEEYNAFYRAEKESQRYTVPMYHQSTAKWVNA